MRKNKEVKTKNTGVVLLLAASLLVLGIVLGWMLKCFFPDIRVIKNLSPLRLGGYKFISPLLVCDTESKQSPGLSKLDTDLRDVIKQETDGGNIEKASVYLRKISTNDQIDINSDEKYYPASLNKIPVMIAYYKMAETNPNMLNQKVNIAGGSNENESQEIQPRESIKTGQTYTIEQLIEHMIIYSDNNALNLLINHMDHKLLEQVYSDLQIPVPAERGVIVDYMTAHDYSYFLRVLYNATYLKRDFSEKALDLLSRVDYKDALIAGVPEGVTVSHKFGLLSSYSGEKVASRELHDCGIVYKENSPYFICVMTKSQSSIDKINNAIKNISSVAYQEVGN